MVNILRKTVHQFGFIYKIIYMIRKLVKFRKISLRKEYVHMLIHDCSICLFVFFFCFSSCFQLVGKESYDLNDMQSLLQDPNNIDLYDVYNKYNVEGVQVNIFKTYKIKLPFNSL
jgi:hypothetical protein